jgi:O-antigen/teichoic acid export membrane protein
VYFASQGLVVTKLLGLEAAAILAVTSRSSGIAMQSIWKPFDAFSPRWQVAFCSGDVARVTREYRLMVRFTILVAAAAATSVALLNQPFVLWWTKPGYFGGLGLSLLLCVFMIIQGINRCFIAPFVLTVKMKAYTVVSIGSVVSAILLMVGLTKWLGLVGIPAGLILGDLVFPMWFYIKKGGEGIGIKGFEVIGQDILFWLPIIALAGFVSTLMEKFGFESSLVWLLSALACSMVFAAPLLWRAVSLLRELKREGETASGPVVEASLVEI